VSQYIEKLREAIRRLHGVESRHVESVPIKEMFQGKTVWNGAVEVFDLIGHPKASRAYAWTHDAEGGKKCDVTVLHVPPIDSPLAAVRASIIQDYRENNEAEA
jgi:hypothetical protein